MASGKTKIAELSRLIAENTSIVDEYLTAHALPTPSFDADGPLTLPIPAHEQAIIAAQDAVIASTQDLHNLMKGPTEMLMGIGAINPNDVLSLGAVYRYKLASLFAINETISFAALSIACGLNEVDLRRIVRHAMSNHIFQDREGRVGHTAASRVLAESGMMRDIIGVMCEEMFPGAARTVDALIKFDGVHTPSESGFSLGHNSDKGLYDELSLHIERGRRFAGAMSGFAARTNVDLLASAFDWTAVPTVVDVGGGWGSVSVALAQRFSGPSFLVQDIEHVVADGPAHVPDELKGRVQFAAHNIFKTQNVTGADVYLMRHVLHNFPDSSCKDILRAQIPALKHGAHIIIQDAVIPEPRNELPAYKEKFRRSMDLIMLTFFAARERTLKDWTSVIREADSRFDISYAKSDYGPPSNIIDVTWRG